MLVCARIHRLLEVIDSKARIFSELNVSSLHVLVKMVLGKVV